MLESLASGLEGDFNNDGVVNLADYNVWRDNLGAPAGTLNNDPDSVTIGASQYTTWKTNFGASLSPSNSLGGTTAPEPSTWILSSLLTLAITVRHRIAKH